MKEAGVLEDLLRRDQAVRRLALGVVGDGEEAAELVQETWLRELSRDDSPAEPEAEPLLRRLAFNRRRGEARRRRRENLSRAPLRVPEPGEILEREELRRRLVRGVLALPESLRTPVILRYFEERSLTEIAEHVGATVEAVRGRLRRALVRVRASLSPHDERTWLGLLAGCGLPGSRGSAPTTAAEVLPWGTVTMSARAKVVAAAFLVIIGLGVGVWHFIVDAPEERAAPTALAIAGTIKADAGISLPRCTVHARPLDKHTRALSAAVTAEGAFRVEGCVEKHYHLSLEVPGFLFPILCGEPVPGGAEGVACTLESRVCDPAHISGSWRSSSKRDAKGVRGRVERVADGMFHAFRTGADGTFSLGGIPAGRYRIVFLDAAGAEIGKGPVCDVAPGDRLTLDPISVR